MYIKVDLPPPVHTATAPACDPQDGSNPHGSPPTCVCGTGKLCSSDTGMVCVGMYSYQCNSATVYRTQV